MKSKAGTVALTGVLAALALTLSFLENLLPPLPMTPPGFKLGLSNIVSMYAAGSLGLPSALFLAAAKGSFAFFSRGAIAGIMSLSGSLCSAFLAWILQKRTAVSLMILGVSCALAHNLAQLLCAWALTSVSAFFYTPFLLLLSILTGMLTGTALKYTMPALERIQGLWVRR